MFVNNLENVDGELHLMHLLHEALHVLRVLADKRHQILVGHDVLQILGVPRIFHVDLWPHIEPKPHTLTRVVNSPEI